MEVFEMLDSDGDGKVSAAKIDISGKLFFVS